MSENVICVDNLSKRYEIGHVRERHDRIKDVLTESLRRLDPRRGGRADRERTQTFWALRDMSFGIAPGEVVGIIGRNGAGKSTLLKILSRITRPTSGRATIHGRVGSLLEVGTGFDRELTGRENVYLNGAILGMRKAEIDRKFDQIVEFSGVGEFLDTPVKRYSSGMYVRLAFAVAAHLEPEILIIDEVLAVGDAEFQRKCLGKMQDVAKHGRTVLYVSHNLGSVETLCTRAMVLDHGRVVFDGGAQAAVGRYAADTRQQEGDPFASCERTGNGLVQITSVSIESDDGEPRTVLRTGEPVVFVIGYRAARAGLSGVSAGLGWLTESSVRLLTQYSHLQGVRFDRLPLEGQFRFRLQELPLAQGHYLLGCRLLVDGEEADWPRTHVPFSVVLGNFFPSADAHYIPMGCLALKGNWTAAESSDGHKTRLRPVAGGLPA